MNVDAWVRDGGIVVAASERARRALLSAYHRARQAEGRTAWNTPPIYDWTSFARQQWTERTADGRLLLSTSQERRLWARLIAEHGAAATILREPLRRTAAMAMEAHALLCAYAPRFLDARARGSWRQDSGTFSSWLAAFDEACAREALVSGARLPLELIPLLKADPEIRPPLLIAGFDRLLPVQHQLFETWGRYQTTGPDRHASEVRSFAAPDLQSELEACAHWCQSELERKPNARLLVVTQAASMRRGEMERVFLRIGADNPSARFEFSLGVPLASVGIARAAQLLLTWLKRPVTEAELDWLVSTPFASRDAKESAELQGTMRDLRRRSLQRTQWSIDAFAQMGAAQRPGLPSTWAARMQSARRALENASRSPRRPVEWAAEIPRLLELAGWPGAHAPSSMEFQALQRFSQVVDECGALGFDGRRMDWDTFSAELNDTLAETLFAPESEDAPILIAGPAESAGLTADGVWFLGSHEDAWPARGAMHPLLPTEVQREYAMPHSSAQADYELARTITGRLLASAAHVFFSYARQEDGVETRASRLVAQIAGPPLPLPPNLAPKSTSAPLSVPFADASRITFEPGTVRGGTAVLTAQSQCPFKAFATARLDAQTWDAAEPALSVLQRGKLLHGVLHAIWRGKPDGLRSLDDLRAVGDNRNFVLAHVRRVMQSELDEHAREEMPPRYLELEAERLTRLVTEWLRYESERAPFSVEKTEFDAIARIEGLLFKFRLDRVDKLSDGSVLVVDYKTGQVTPKAWELPRPDDVQLPLYAAFGLPEEWSVGGLAFAKIRAGEACLAGCVKDAEATLGRVNNLRTLKNSGLRTEAINEWRDNIQQLARDFLNGHASVDPRDAVKTCARCGLHTICRVQGQGLATEHDEEGANGEYDSDSPS